MSDAHSRDGASSHEPSFAERINRLSKKRRELIRPVQEHPRDYVLLPIRNLAERLKTDPATVLRIVRSLGFASYRHFKVYLHELAIASATSLEGMRTQVRLTNDGITGFGEGAPIVRYHENAEDGKKAIESIAPLLAAANPWQFQKLMSKVSTKLQGQFAAQAALDIALMDWVGKKSGLSLHRMLGLDPSDTPITTFSIGIDTPETTRQKVQEADPFPVLKIKVGLNTDEATLAAVRSATKKPLRVDANEGWKDKEEAVRKINWLETQGVEFVEQPMPAHMLEETRWVRSRVHLPILADEAAVNAQAIPKLVDTYDGINVKLDKCGGVQQALRMIYIAKSLGMKTMLGCMISSSISVTAAAHLSPLVDYADLDGNLLIANDAFSGVTVNQGKLILPESPGLGLAPAQ